ncbi:hypothetical protein Hanom_Chr09g00765571 [Helianthus anomalus]
MKVVWVCVREREIEVVGCGGSLQIYKWPLVSGCAGTPAEVSHMAAICTSVHSFSPPAVAATSRLSSSASTSPSSSVSLFSRRRRMKTASFSMVVCMAPDEEKLTRRNPLDFPVFRDEIEPVPYRKLEGAQLGSVIRINHSRNQSHRLIGSVNFG